MYFFTPIEKPSMQFERNLNACRQWLSSCFSIASQKLLHNFLLDFLNNMYYLVNDSLYPPLYTLICFLLVVFLWDASWLFHLGIFLDGALVFSWQLVSYAWFRISTSSDNSISREHLISIRLTESLISFLSNFAYHSQFSRVPHFGDWGF